MDVQTAAVVNLQHSANLRISIFLSFLAAGVGHGLKMVWPNCAPLLFISLHVKLKIQRVIHFLKVDVVKGRIDILNDLWFGIPSLFNTFPSVYQAKVFQEFTLTFQILWCAATFCAKILGFAAPHHHSPPPLSPFFSYWWFQPWDWKDTIF